MRRMGRWLAREELEHATDRIAYLEGLVDRLRLERDEAIGGDEATGRWRRRALRAEATLRARDAAWAELRDRDPEHRAVVGSGRGAE